MRVIKNYKQFNESMDISNAEVNPSDLDLDKMDEIKVKETIFKKISSMSDYEMNLVFDELENMTKKLNCNIEDLTDPIFVKKHLDEITNYHNVIEEGFFSNIGDKITNFFSKVFEWGSALGSIIMICVSALKGSFWGAFTGGMALSISILASAYLQYLRSKK